MKGKRVLITGITGFVGFHLANRLTALGADVYGIARGVNGKNILQTNVLNYSTISAFIKNSKIEICYHLAGDALVEQGQKNPFKTFKTNVLGTLNILEIARKQKFERVIVASTVHVYGNNKLPYLERYTPKPSRPYETSKACTDLMAQSYAETFNLPVLIPRFVNIYGPGDLNYSRLIPKTIQAVISGKAPLMWGGQAVRDYLYIDDAVDAYIALATVDLKKIGNSKLFNIGSDQKMSVHEIINKIILLSGQKVRIKKVREKRSDEITSQYVSSRKARTLLTWDPKTDLDEGLRKTIAWYSKSRINS